MKAEWIEDTDPKICLCCGQDFVLREGMSNVMTPERCARALMIFEALGLTREDLLTKHRAQIDYQAPGFAEWLIGQ